MGNFDMTIATDLLDEISFTAETGPLYDREGYSIPKDIGRRVYRSDTGETLAVCGSKFEPIQHSDIVQPIFGTLSEQGYLLERRAVDRHSLYDLKGRKGAFVNHSLEKSGAILRTDIILGDFIQPTGSSSYMDEGPDTNFFRISILNSHNGSYAARVNTSYLRVVCMNGMTSPNFSAGFYGRHTKNFSVEAMAKQIISAMEMMDQDADRFGRMAKTPVTPKQAERMLQLTVAKMPNKPNGDPHFSEPLVQKILNQFQYEDQTVWGLYNAVTWWQTHSEIKANANKLTTTISREKQVAGMLRSPQFEELMA